MSANEDVLLESRYFCLYAAKIEEPDLPIPKVDTIVSEPIGVLLIHERMVRGKNSTVLMILFYKLLVFVLNGSIFYSAARKLSVRKRQIP